MAQVWQLSWQSFYANVIEHYIWYHAFTLSIFAGILVMIAVHHYGSESNLTIAKKCQKSLELLLSKSFSDYDGELVVESANMIKMYLAGRETCLFGVCAFAMVPRQQIVSFMLNPILIGLKDELVIEVPINSEHPVALTMAIIRKTNMKQINKKKFPDIKHLCKQYKPLNPASPNVPSSHAILLEKLEHAKYLLSGETEANLFKQHARSVKMVYLSDMNRYGRYPMTVRMTVVLGKDILPLVQWLIGFIDRVARLRMSAGERKQARKRREGLRVHYEY